MYAGTTFRHGSGRFVGVHQRIDRAARRLLKRTLTKNIYFPNIKDILYFEGNNGPDGLKRKNPGEDEPWHFIDPTKPEDKKLLVMINDHIVNLAQALRSDNHVRASFEAAWLAHAITDGLTPAHHYPLGDKIEELWGKAYFERSSVKDKNLIKGNGFVDTISKNWQYWGAKGVFTSHSLFEMGVASAISSDRFLDLEISNSEISKMRRIGFDNTFFETLKLIDDLHMYDELIKKGWTQKLARQAKNVLVPEIIKIVTLAWLCAIDQSIENKNAS